MPKRDPHEVLGIERGAGLAAVKAAWRRLARAHHPDLTASDPTAVRAATARMAEINAAYDLLRREVAERLAGLRERARPATSPVGRAGARGATGTASDAPPRRRGGPPPPRPTRPVTGRVDTSDTIRPRNATTTTPGFRIRGSANPPRASQAEREPRRASDPNGPIRRRRATRWSPPREPSLEDARAVELTFGKFHGHTLGEVADFEPSYIDWLAVTISRDPELIAAARVVRRRLDELGIRRRSRPPGRAVPHPD